MIKKDSSNREIRIEHIFNFSRDHVFKAWTNPELLKQWYAPEGCTIHFNNIDIRPGGTYHSCIRNPNHGDCWTIGEYIEITEPERIIQTVITADKHGNPIAPEAAGMDPNWPQKSLLTVSFVEIENKTKIILKQSIPEKLAKHTGAHPSWIAMLERLESSLGKETFSTTI